MGRKVFISFMGTSDYVPVNYVFEGKRIDNVKYIQEAMMRLFCSDWTENDTAYIFLTEAAKARNWDPKEDNEKFSQRIPKLREGGLKMQIQEITETPEGFDSEQVWELFEMVFSCLEKDDEVIFDITHSFRSIPMLGMILMNYAKVLKGVKIQGVYYGAFEKLGIAKNVLKMPEHDRNAPIISLNDFVKLQEWTGAINEFDKFGSSQSLAKLMKQEVKTIKKESIDDAKQIQLLANQLNKLSAALSTCRGQDIISTMDYEGLNNCLSSNRDHDFISQLHPLLQKIEKKIEPFTNKSWTNGLAAVSWCLDHEMIQQAATFLMETIQTLVIENTFGNENITNFHYRECASCAFFEINRGREADVPRSIPEDFDFDGVVDKMKEFIQKYPNLAKEYSKLVGGKGLRNDINHCGFSDPSRSAHTIKEQVKQIYENVVNVF
ncbi:TIGR02221 family CRISPR-associated protein [Persicobacter psychrovividus]|uniref:CRISPR-associated protein n=1 Tax=Persicobacter psychrovividus TaxID=387638 RepID=A0ABM7VM25_9BACT|nr:hypothetical protein PEPS_43370 [Persicobacter psychrovividus]